MRPPVEVSATAMVAPRETSCAAISSRRGLKGDGGKTRASLLAVVVVAMWMTGWKREGESTPSKLDLDTQGCVNTHVRNDKNKKERNT